MKTLIQLSKQLEVSRKTLWYAAKTGKFAAQKTGRDYLIQEDSPEFLKWLEEHLIRVKKNSH